MAKRIVLFALFLVGSFAAPLSTAQRIDQMKEFDQYHVYYNLLNTKFLEPEIAEKYDVPREEDLALLTISVRGPNAEGVMTDQPAKVSGSVTDLVRHMPLDFEEFQDPTAVYYLAEVPVEGRAELDFSVTIKPKDSAEVYELEFSEMLYPPAPINR